MSFEILIIYILLIKGMTIGFQSILVAHAMTYFRQYLAGKLYIGVMISYLAYSLIAFTSVSENSRNALFLCAFFSSMGPSFFWLLVNSLYQETYKVNPLYWLLLISIAIAAVTGGVIENIAVSATEPADLTNLSHLLLFYYPNTANVVLLVLSLHAIVNNWETDLVAARRWLWITVVPFVGIIMLAPLLIMLLQGSYVLPMWFEVLQATYIFFIFFTGVSWLNKGDPRQILESSANSWISWLGFRKDLAYMTEKSFASQVPEKNSNGVLKSNLEKLENLMSVDKAFRKHKLSVTDLANSLEMPEHQLRNMINQNLGYRNFNDFVNHYRIMHIIDELKNPESDHLPIMSLALDAGFNSIAPFNRAFKAKLGTTPNEYRARIIANRSN